MIYVQQHQHHVRNRKETLIPKSTDDMIEVLSVIGGDVTKVITMDTESYYEVASSPESSEHGGSGAKPRKRAKLDHLSADEKAQHRKMMNRISAQSARDRQKTQMQIQEVTIKNLVSANEGLKKENTTLNVKCEKLTEENERLSSILKEYEEKFQKLQSNETVQPEVTVKLEPTLIYSDSINAEERISSSLEPAVPRTVPLPKGPELLTNFSCIPTLLWICFLWTLTRQDSSKLSKTLLSKSSALETNFPLDLKKQCFPSLKLKMRNHNKSVELTRIRDPG